MSRILFMTVGTGVGDSEDKIHSLAHGLMKSITHSRPDKIIFFGSELSKKTVNSIEEQYSQEGRGNLPQNEFILINNIDEFKECFGKMKEKTLEYGNHEIIIDYTSGTKTMTTGAAICSLLYHKDLTVVYGDREQNGIVSKETEQVKTQNLYLAYDELLFDEFKKFFNHFRFQAAAETLKKIVARNDKIAYLKLTQAYRAWDLFNHEKCKEFLASPEVGQLKGLENVISHNKSVVGTLSNDKQRNKCPQLVADLLNNAKRRGMEQKYDDAVARLYRTVELIAQCILKQKFNICTSDVDLEKLSISIQNQINLERNEYGKITVGLRDSYKILKFKGEGIGKKVSEDERLKCLLKRRNESILGHGLKSITKEEYEELLEKTIELAREIYPNLEMKEAEFPQL